MARSHPIPRRGSNSAAVEALESRRLLSATPAVRPADANGAAPSVMITAPVVTSASQAAETITLTLTDSAGIDPTSIKTDNLTVVNQATGAALAVTGAALSPADGSATTDVATYTVAAPDSGGMFTSADNGTYSVILGLNQIYDPTGSAAPQAGGSFTIAVLPAGATAPTAVVAPPAAVTTALPSVDVTVTYTATSGGADLIDASTINTGNVIVTGPKGTLNVSGVSLNPAGGNAVSVVATYTVAAPGGAFTTANDGPHTVALNPNQPVRDTNGLTAVGKPASATFGVALPSALTVAISPPPSIIAAQPTEAITVIYDDVSGINLATISPANLLVTEEGGANPTPLAVTGVSLSPDAGTPTQVTATYTVAAPNGAFSLASNGTYDVALQFNQVADVNQVFAEPVTSSFSVAVPGVFALTPSLAKLKLPAAVAAGANLRLSVPVSITNHGNVASAGTSDVTLYASTTQDLTGATEIAAMSARLALKVNKARTINVKVPSLPASLAAGSYYLLAQVTGANGASAVAASPSTLNVAPPFIDLTGSLPPVPATLKAGKKTSAAVTVINEGNVTAAGSLEVQFLARPAGTTGSADVPLATPSVRIKLAAGASKRLRLPFVLPPTLTAGTSYTLVAVLDPGNLLGDSNRSNNALAGNYLFTVT